MTVNKICVFCHHIESTTYNINCPRCVATGHLYRMLALSDFQASRERARRTCTDADRLAVTLSELDAAERVLREFEQSGNCENLNDSVK